MDSANGIDVTELILLVSEIFTHFQNNNLTEAFSTVVKFIKRLSYIVRPSFPPRPPAHEGVIGIPHEDSYNRYFSD